MNGLSAIFPCADRAVALIIKVKQRAAFENLWHKFWHGCIFNGQFAIFLRLLIGQNAENNTVS